MADAVAFSLVGDAGAPKTDAVPAFVDYRDRAGGARAQPTISHLGGGVYGFTPAAADEAVGVGFLIDNGAGASPRRLSGTVTTKAAPYLAWHLEDAAGALWAGAAPTFGAYADFEGTPRTPPAIVAVAGAYLFTATPTAEDIAADVAFRLDSPAGAFPSYLGGSIDVPDSLPATAGQTVVEAVRAELLADATVSGLVGTRIYAQVAPQKAPRPYVVLTEVSGVPENSFDGTAETRLVGSLVQADCYAVRYLDAKALAQAADNVVANLSRPELSAVRDSVQDLYDNETQLHRVSMDFSVWR